MFCLLKDACVRNKRWHALALLYDKNGQKPRGETDETAAAETWRSLALGHLVEGVDTDGEGAVAGRGAQRYVYFNHRMGNVTLTYSVLCPASRANSRPKM